MRPTSTLDLPWDQSTKPIKVVKYKLLFFLSHFLTRQTEFTARMKIPRTTPCLQWFPTFNSIKMMNTTPNGFYHTTLPYTNVETRDSDQTVPRIRSTHEMKRTELKSNRLKRIMATALHDVKHNPEYFPLIASLQQQSELCYAQ